MARDPQASEEERVHSEPPQHEVQGLHFHCPDTIKSSGLFTAPLFALSHLSVPEVQQKYM